MKTVSIATLGCKVNQFESEALLEAFGRKGYREVPFGEKSDVTIINTCTVTHRADFQSRQLVRRAHRSNSDALLIVTGCYAQVDPEGLSKIDGVNYLLGNQEKNRALDLLPLMERGELPKIQADDIQNEASFVDVSLLSFHHHTRAFLKIQDGCNGRCSYCIVPDARGRSRSLLPEKVLQHLRALKQKGYKEVVLTGIHLGAYGLDLIPPVPLEKLLEQVEVDETPSRIRLTSIEPADFTPGLVDLLSRSGKICPHLHIPIQSGDNEILKRMNRDYDRSFLSDLIQGLYERIRTLSIGADVIVGFPGETEERFQNTLQLISSLSLTYLHVFPFSRRKGTEAAQLFPGVDEARIKERAGRLRTLGHQKRQAFYQSHLGKRLDVLIEGRQKDGEDWKGFSRNYIPVFIKDEYGSEGMDWTNQEVCAEMVGLGKKGVIGKRVRPSGDR